VRYYSIDIDGGKSYSSRGNPSALNVELELSVYDADTFIGGTVVIWGVALEDISSSNNLHNKAITISGGMQPGLPFATAQSAEAGLLYKGKIQQSFGNWVGTEMCLTLVLIPGPIEKNPPPPNAPDPPPKNLVLDWRKGKPLADALRQCILMGLPEWSPNISISSQLVAPQDNVGYYSNFRELNNYVRAVSHQIMQGDPKYTGVGICLQQGEVTVHDNTSPPSPKEIAFIDLVGQPTWIAPTTIQIKTVMRGDMKVGDHVTLPPTRVVTTADAQSGISGTPLTFSGTFEVKSLRHIGNFRQPDGAAWVTIVEAYTT
jgi:hypothetical protein